MDWLAFALSALGIVFNAKRKLLCWPIWFASNVAWAAFAYSTNQKPLLYLQIVFGAMNIYGWISWKEKP